MVKLSSVIKKIRTQSVGETIFYINKNVKRIVTDKISHAFFKVCRLLPLREDILVFRTERDYCDNGRALYEYLMTLDDKKRFFVWVVEEPSLYAKRCNTVFVSPYKSLGLKFYYYLAVAKNLIETHNLTQVKLRPGQNYISLWHGMMIKKGKSSNANGIEQQQVFDYVLNTSKNTAKQQAEYLGCDEKYVVSLGFPRNDVLLNNNTSGKENPLIQDHSYNKVIIWMPTFRSSVNPYLSETSIDTATGLPLLNDFESVQEISKYCRSLNVLLMVKIHHLQAEKEVFNQHFENIMFVQDDELIDKDIQLYEMLGKTDALITDVSSVYVDYMLLNKPMGFILTDFKGYQNSRGVLFDNLLDLLPGQFIYTMDDMKQFLQNVCDGVDKFEAEREEVKHFFHDYPDGNSCERIKNYFNL